MNTDMGETRLCYSDDGGLNWQSPTKGIQFARESGFSLKAIWYIEPGHSDEPGTIYVGTDPANLWVSNDYGEHWEVNKALATYPERDTWGASLEGTCLHSIVIDHEHKNRIWVSISGAGTLRSDDNGKSWQVLNEMQQGERERVGTNSHRLLQHPDKPEVLYQQSRNGIFISQDGGEHWQSILGNLPSFFGFPLALDRQAPDTLFTVVLDPEKRVNLGDQFAVYRTENVGRSWEVLTKGLPKGPEVQMKVLRHGLCTDTKDPCGVYVGTMSGEIFASSNRGESWQLVTDGLPPIYAVTATEWE
jgi:photosystem II stability/assembly factor-like uncharacterized protein